MRRSQGSPSLDTSSIEAALNAMDADELRALVRETLPSLDDTASACFVDALISRAARNDSGFAPVGPSSSSVEEIETFAKAALRVGRAAPAQVDAYLRQGTHAFLAKDYAAALRIFRTLLVPLGDFEIDLGQHETLDEVLTVQPYTCVVQYVVATYMTSAATVRAASVFSAMEEMHSIYSLRRPLRELEQAAIEPLPDLDNFSVRWANLIEASIKDGVTKSWDSNEDYWLREAIQKTRGPDGLAELARTSKRATDLKAWCRSLEETKDWRGALRAYEESAKLFSEHPDDLGPFLDGAALAEQELESTKLPTRLEQAWRKAPSLLRLVRWLGCSASRTVLRKRLGQALAKVPKPAHRQQALLFTLGEDYPAAAKLLASAKGLGWSDNDHPGHLMFPVFLSLLGDLQLPHLPELSLEWLDFRTTKELPQLRTPELATLIRLANIQAPKDSKIRAAITSAMRTAAYKRIAGVTQNKRRRHYGHAASLALACAQLDHNTDGPTWLDGIRNEFRRYPALQHELK